jgi:tRNA-Thr(GGU) m(6)t(6)A37 methyltransferase TsaA
MWYLSLFEKNRSQRIRCDERSPDKLMVIEFKPIGFVENQSADVPRHWSVSNLEGTLVILPQYEAGITDLKTGQRIVVLFHFHRSAPFTDADLRQAKRKNGQIKSVFSICSPRRPNAIGLSVVKVLSIDRGRIRVKGLDMYGGTPILDIKPYVDVENHEPDGMSNI